MGHGGFMRRHPCGVRGVLIDVIYMKSIGFTHQKSTGNRLLAVAFFWPLILLLFFQPFALAQTETHQASFLPWSGHWWPYTEGGLGTGLGYRGTPAPLEKYGLLTTGSVFSTALTWYLKEHYDPNAEPWYGLCLYWARAACYEHINILPSSEDNLLFRVGDKKGLLTLAHNSDSEIYGQGQFPEVFHQWLLTYIKEQKEAFVADLSAGPEVWSHPIHKYDMETSLNGNVKKVR
jgi:hypothetical protein